jgi:hypothetical protein
MVGGENGEKAPAWRQQIAWLLMMTRSNIAPRTL